MSRVEDEEALVVLCTAPDMDTAVRLGRGLVEARLAACVNVVPGLRSIYRYEGEVHDEAEVQLLVKTRRGCFAALEAWLDAHHPYDVPEVLALPVAAGAPGYLSWLTQQTGESERDHDRT